MVAFLNQNPAFAGAQQVYDMQAAQDQADLSRFRLDEAMRTRDANDAVDAALRDYVTQKYPAGSAPGVRQTGPQGASLAGQQPSVTTAAGPGPAATAGQGNAPGFDALMQTIAPQMPQRPNMNVPLPNATPGMSAGQPTALPNAKPGMAQPPVMLAGGQPATLSGQQPVQQPTTLNRIDLARTLAQTPGTGQAALQLIQDQEAIEAQADKDKDHAVENFFKSIDAGDVNSAHYWGQKAGMDIPPEAYNDAELMRHLSIAGKWKALYGGDLTNFGKFTSQYFDALEKGENVNPYSIYAANPPQSRNAGRSSTKQGDYEFLVSKGVDPKEAMARVWSGGASGGMKYSDALKIARDILKVKIEGLPYKERQTASVNFDRDVQAMAQRFMGGDFGEADADEPDDSDGGYVDQATGRDVEPDGNGNWIYSDDGSPYVPPTQ